MAVLMLDRVVKRFGEFTAVDELSFSVPEGGVFGFLGGNGAGKTTSLRMVLDILRPTTGTIEVLGKPPSRENSTQLGFLPEERGLYRRMTVLDTVVYFGRLKGMKRDAARKSAMALIERFDLVPWARQAVDKLSKGMSQKVQLAAALVNAPRLVILDEPFSGLDPLNQDILEDVVRELARNGSTVVFSTHIMQHAERLCDRMLFLARGRKVFEGGQEDARRAVPARLTMVSRVSPIGLPGVSRVSLAESLADGWNLWDVGLAPDVVPGDILEICTAQSFPLRDFTVHSPSLHDVFLRLVGPGNGR